MLFTITKFSSLSRHSDSGARLRKLKHTTENCVSKTGFTWKFENFIVYHIQYWSNYSINFYLLFCWRTNQVFNTFTLNCWQLPMWNHVTCDVINCNGCRPLEHLNSAGGRRSFKPNPNELDSIHQVREKCQINHEALTRNFNKNHLYLTLRFYDPLGFR